MPTCAYIHDSKLRLCTSYARVPLVSGVGGQNPGRDSTASPRGHVEHRRIGIQAIVSGRPEARIGRTVDTVVSKRINHGRSDAAKHHVCARRILSRAVFDHTQKSGRSTPQLRRLTAFRFSTSSEATLRTGKPGRNAVGHGWPEPIAGWSPAPQGRDDHMLKRGYVPQPT